jgi:hypothetical protein
VHQTHTHVHPALMASGPTLRERPSSERNAATITMRGRTTKSHSYCAVLSSAFLFRGIDSLSFPPFLHMSGSTDHTSQDTSSSHDDSYTLSTETLESSSAAASTSPSSSSTDSCHSESMPSPHPTVIQLLPKATPYAQLCHHRDHVYARMVNEEAGDGEAPELGPVSSVGDGGSRRTIREPSTGQRTTRLADFALMDRIWAERGWEDLCRARPISSSTNSSSSQKSSSTGDFKSSKSSLEDYSRSHYVGTSKTSIGAMSTPQVYHQTYRVNEEIVWMDPKWMERIASEEDDLCLLESAPDNNATTRRGAKDNHRGTDATCGGLHFSLRPRFSPRTLVPRRLLCNRRDNSSLGAFPVLDTTDPARLLHESSTSYTPLP